MSMMNQITDHIEALQEQAMKAYSYQVKHQGTILEMEETLEHLENNLIDTHIDGQSVDLVYSGDGDTLSAIFKGLRGLGYEPDSRPTEEPQASFSTWWKHPDQEMKVWLSFSSKVCHRKLVGTEIKEVDVWEVVCE